MEDLKGLIIPITKDEINEAETKVKKGVLEIIRKEYFLGYIIQYVKIQQESQKTDTAYVYMKDKQTYIGYNVRYINMWEHDHVVFILKHELLHITLGHLSPRIMQYIKSTQRNSDEYRVNSALDLAVNSFLLPKKTDILTHPFYSRIESPEFYKFDKYLNFETYYDLLNNREEKEDQNLKNCNVHDFFQDDENTQEQIINEALTKELVRQAYMDASKHTNIWWGSLSQEITEHLIHVMADEQIDWFSYIRNYLYTAQKSDKRNTWSKINKKYPMIYSGKLQKRSLPKILIGIDCSSSVNNDLLHLFLNNISTLSQYAEFDLIQFDVIVYEDTKMNIKHYSKLTTFKRNLDGGTNFNVISNYAIDSRYDILFIATDMYCEKPENINIDRLWITTTPETEWFETDEIILKITN